MAYDIEIENEFLQKKAEKAAYDHQMLANAAVQGAVAGATGRAGIGIQRDPRAALIMAAESFEKRAKALRALAEELPADPRRMFRDALDALDYVDV